MGESLDSCGFTSKKPKKGRLSRPCTDDPEDVVFAKSPFSCSTMATFKFKQGDPLLIHRDILHRNPKLRALGRSDDGWCSVESIALEQISRSTGHVLVHYLYTDTYNTLPWIGPADGQKEAISKLKTAFEVYDTALKYDLDGLVELARKQITLLSKGTDALIIIDIVKEVYPIAKGDDVWFRAFMKDMIKIAFEKPTTVAPAGETNATKAAAEEPRTNRDVPLDSILFQIALDFYREKIEALAAAAAAAAAPASKSAQQWGLLAANTSEKDARLDCLGASTLVFEAADPGPEREPEDDTWNIFTTTSKSKKTKKSKIITAETPVPEPEPSGWFNPTLKAKKKKGKLATPESESEPKFEAMFDPEPAIDPCDLFGPVSAKKKKGKLALPEPEPEA